MLCFFRTKKAVGRSLDLPIAFLRERYVEPYVERYVERDRAGKIVFLFQKSESIPVLLLLRRSKGMLCFFGTKKQLGGLKTSQSFFGGSKKRERYAERFLERKCIKPGGKKSKISFPQIAFLLEKEKQREHEEKKMQS